LETCATFYTATSGFPIEITPLGSRHLIRISKNAEGAIIRAVSAVIPWMRGKHIAPFARCRAALEIRALVAEGARDQFDQSEYTTYYGWFCGRKSGTAPTGTGSSGPTLSALHARNPEDRRELWHLLALCIRHTGAMELIETIAACDKVARYIDIPLQHIDQAMLPNECAVRRRVNTSKDLIGRLRSGIPGVSCGPPLSSFPGETDAKFTTELISFIRARFISSGFSNIPQGRLTRRQDAGSTSARGSRQRASARQRRATENCSRDCASKVGQRIKLLMDQPLIARTEADAPDVDTRVILSSAELVGEFVYRTISGTRGYDLLA
jgi:ribosomal protein S12 methylthiotransferase